MTPAGIEPATFQFVAQHLNHCDRYSCTLSLTSALDGVGGQRHAPAALYPRERPGTHCIGSWVGPRAGLDEWGKSRPRPGFDVRTVPPVASRYTDCALTSHGVHKLPSHSLRRRFICHLSSKILNCFITCSIIICAKLSPQHKQSYQLCNKFSGDLRSNDSSILLSYFKYLLEQGCTNKRDAFFRVATFRLVAPIICQSSVWNLEI